uniref:Uncharacterized protein n=1 Tax=Glossina pallidipes TaxID=7398 RepID=A0A1A9Z625_GLOPL
MNAIKVAKPPKGRPDLDKPASSRKRCSSSSSSISSLCASGGRFRISCDGTAAGGSIRMVGSHSPGGTGTSVRSPIRDASFRRIKAANGFSKKSTSPTNMLLASAPGECLNSVCLPSGTAIVLVILVPGTVKKRPSWLPSASDLFPLVLAVKDNDSLYAEPRAPTTASKYVKWLYSLLTIGNFERTVPCNAGQCMDRQTDRQTQSSELSHAPNAYC